MKYGKTDQKSFKISHDQASPFPKTAPDGRIIVDERCLCWAPRSHHMDTTAYGHGACPPNNCKKYSFRTYIFGKKGAGAGPSSI